MLPLKEKLQNRKLLVLIKNLLVLLESLPLVSIQVVYVCGGGINHIWIYVFMSTFYEICSICFHTYRWISEYYLPTFIIYVFQSQSQQIVLQFHLWKVKCLHKVHYQLFLVDLVVEEVQLIILVAQMVCWFCFILCFSLLCTII